MPKDANSAVPDASTGILDQKSPRTVEKWRELLDSDAKQKKGQWRLLTREMFNSLAFTKLGRAGMIVVLAMLDKLKDRSKKKRGKDRKNVETAYPYHNDGRFSVVGNELRARGLTSPSSIAEGKRQAWELGFFDVLRQGTVARAGEYRYSDRWRLYPSEDHLPHGQQSPGACLYSRFPKKQDASPYGNRT